MMKNLSRILILCAVLLACSCQERGYDKEFLEQQEVSLRIDKKTEFEYNPVNCQLAYNDSRREYRAITDNMSDYFILQLNAVPSSKTENVTGTLTWTGEDYLRNLNNLSFEVEKISGSKIWLWNQSSKAALVIQMVN